MYVVNCVSRMLSL